MAINSVDILIDSDRHFGELETSYTDCGSWMDSPWRYHDTGYIWRHFPADGLGVLDDRGQTSYKTPTLQGTMEPHIFADFQKRTFQCRFRFQIQVDPLFPPLYA